MEPVRVGLMELLTNSGKVQYVIPVYQRNYTWDARKEVKQFLADVKVMLSGERDKHFIGIMICLEKTINMFERERQVIDGQQRLTTLFLILYAIRDIMLESGCSDDAILFEQNYLTYQHGSNFKLKLKPLVSDDEVFQQIVQKDLSSVESTKSKVYLNYCYIKDQIQSLLANHTIEDIVNALNKLYLVCVPISSSDYPQKIFESINATGAKLTASDLIRNFLLMPIASEDQDRYYFAYWQKLENLVSEDSSKLEAFFRFFIIAKNRALVNKNNVYGAFCSWFDGFIADHSVESVFVEIIKYAEFYNTIYKKDINRIDSGLQSVIKEYRQINSDMPAPMLLEFFNLNSETDSSGNPKLAIAQLREVFVILTIYLMRRALCGLDTSDITRYFPKLLSDTLDDCNGAFDNFVEVFKRNLINNNKGQSTHMPDNNEMQLYIRNANMYIIRKQLEIFFKKLEMYNNPAPVDFSKLSIEHIMPQKLSDEWWQALNIDKETFERNLHRLGNLTFAAAPDNSRMGNRTWQEKKEILRQTSHLKMNENILSNDSWTIQDIDLRTELLIDEILRLYPYTEATDVISHSLYIEQGEIKAEGIYFPNNGSVTVKANSKLSTDDSVIHGYSDIEIWRDKLREEEIIGYVNDELVFLEDYTFFTKRVNATALSTAASVILGGSRNGWEYWMTEDGQQANILRN